MRANKPATTSNYTPQFNPLIFAPASSSSTSFSSNGNVSSYNWNNCRGWLLGFVAKVFGEACRMTCGLRFCFAMLKKIKISVFRSCYRASGLGINNFKIMGK